METVITEVVEQGGVRWYRRYVRGLKVCWYSGVGDGEGICEEGSRREEPQVLGRWSLRRKEASNGGFGREMEETEATGRRSC